MCLLEVVPDELVALAPLVEPGRVALVEVCPQLFRDSGVCDVADEHVVEPQCLLLECRRAHGVDEALALERPETAVEARELLRR